MNFQSLKQMDDNFDVKMIKYQLPHRFKTLGLIIAIASFAFLVINKMAFDSQDYRLIAKYVLLLGMLIISISKEKIEDEMIVQIRARSYAFGFTAAILYAMTLPFIDYGLEYISPDKTPIFDEMGDFQILWLLLSIQVLSFELLKRKSL